MGKNNKENSLKKFIFYVIIILLLIVYFPIDFSINVGSVSNLEWSVTLHFDEPDGADNNIYFGEDLDASDEKDSFDIPIPPPGIPPYIRSWFNVDLDEPYNSLIFDARKYPDDFKIWNLSVQWVPSNYISSTNITISWNISDIGASEYNSVVLYDYDNDIVVADMLIDSYYTYSSKAMDQYLFQIICNSTSSPSNSPPYQPSNPYPQDEAKDVSIYSILGWTGGDPDSGDEVSYDVYFGISSNPPLVSNNQSSTSHDIGTLSFNTEYYWKIISWDDEELHTEGLTWHFTTESQTSPQNIPPIADIEGPEEGYVNQTITFDASESYDPDGIVKYYRWDFTNDLSWDTNWLDESTITNVYPNSGNYKVKLQVKDNEGVTNSTSAKITILFLEEDKVLPVAYANGPYSGVTNQNITFDASDSYDSDGIIVNYTWDFGDGTKNNDKITTHSYAKNGSYIVTLLVIDNDGLIDFDKTIANIYNRDSDEDGWGDDEEIKYGTDPNNPEDYPIDTDNDRIPDLLDENDDNDGLSDKLEEKIGSNPKNNLDVLSIEINGITHFLIDTNEDGKSDLFYNSRNGNTTEIEYRGENQFLIDEDGDGKWDYLYDYSFGTINSYQEEESFTFPFFPVVVIILFSLIIIIIALKFYYKKS